MKLIIMVGCVFGYIYLNMDICSLVFPGSIMKTHCQLSACFWERFCPLHFNRTLLEDGVCVLPLLVDSLIDGEVQKPNSPAGRFYFNVAEVGWRMSPQNVLNRFNNRKDFPKDKQFF